MSDIIYVYINIVISFIYQYKKDIVKEINYEYSEFKKWLFNGWWRIVFEWCEIEKDVNQVQKFIELTQEIISGF